MEHALFNTQDRARQIMGRIPWNAGKSIQMVPYFKRHCLQGYRVLLDGKPLTEKSVEILMGKVSCR